MKTTNSEGNNNNGALRVGGGLLATLCPLCNGLINLAKDCPLCGATVEDGGAVENYYGPYSPYEDDALVPAPTSSYAPEDWCWHLIHCSQCDWDTRIPIEQQ